MKRCIGLLSIAALISASAALGAAGDLDTHFGTGGVVVGTSPEDLGPVGIVIVGNGDIVAGGTLIVSGNHDKFGLLGYRPNGAPDPAFGTGGVAIADDPGSDDNAYSLVRRQDGRLVLAGDHSLPSHTVMIAAFTPHGQLDKKFGGGGVVSTTVDDAGYPVAIAAAPRDRVITAGCDSSGNVELARFNKNGSLDNSFGSGGVVTAFAGCAFAVAVQADGKIVVSGTVPGGGFEYREFIARFHENGTPDVHFGTGGGSTVVPTLSILPISLAIQPDGKFVVGGGVSCAICPGASPATVTRFTHEGLLDPKFESSGIATVPGDDMVRGVAVDPLGRILGVDITASGFEVFRLRPNGTLDPAFGSGGAVETSILAYDTAFALALQRDGKIVAGGSVYNGTDDVFALARYLG
jgi:uncharacterized delta-60 repeat protein